MTMNPDWLLKHFEQISEAPDAVRHLRRFILDLAVRGKILEQNPKDEPASKLLKRIGEEKERLLAGGRDRNQEMPPIENNQTSFPIPPNWIWVRLGQVIKLWNGFAFKSSDFKQRGVPVIRIGDLQNGQVVLNSTVFVDEKVAESVDESFWIPENALLIAMSGATTGKVAFNHTGQRLLLNQRVGRVQAFSIPDDFLRFFFDTIVQQNLSIAFGTAIPNLSAKQINETAFPLPPLAEQHRIVVKVDELMALCDELEAAQQKRERRRDRLVAATLNGLGRDRSPNGPQLTNNGAFGESALPKFLLTHFPRLTTRPEHIHQLRQTILNLAVRGQLVPQDSNDEPASELLKRIQAEKARLEKDGKVKREKLVEAGADPFPIPENWKWARLGELTELITKGSSPKWQGIAYVSKDEGVLFVTSENVGNYRLRKLDELKYVEKRFNEIEPRSILRFGDILMNLVGASIGRTAIYDLHNVANINQAVALIRLIQSAPNMCAEFLLHYLNSPSAIQLMMASQVVTAQPNISLTNAREFPIPVPPLAEQHRIVAKVDELMGLCDELESRLSSTAITRRQLLEATLSEAIAPS